jgi:hypothetical protein
VNGIIACFTGRLGKDCEVRTTRAGKHWAGVAGLWCGRRRVLGVRQVGEGRLGGAMPPWSAARRRYSPSFLTPAPVSSQSSASAGPTTSGRRKTRARGAGGRVNHTRIAIPFFLPLGSS